MPGIHPSARFGVSGWMDPGGKHRDDNAELGAAVEVPSGSEELEVPTNETSPRGRGRQACLDKPSTGRERRAGGPTGRLGDMLPRAGRRAVETGIMQFGVFDHLDLGAVPLGRALREPAAADRGLRPRGIAHLSPRRAPCHAARHGALAQRVPGRRGPAHAAAALRAAGLHAVAAPSPARRRGDLHARPDERRQVGAGCRPRGVALRGRLLRRRPRQGAGDVCRGAERDPEGARHQDAELRGRALQLPRRADRARAGAAPAPSALVRPGAARGFALGGRQPRQRRLQRSANAGAPGDRRLSPRLGGGRQRRRRRCR